MKHLNWDYLGWQGLVEQLDYIPLQSDWNLTLFHTVTSAIEEENFNFFCSERIIEIFKESPWYDNNKMTYFNNKVIELLFDTPKIYVVKNEITDFTMIDYDNYGSVTVKNSPF